jgi:hypothetical protein
LPFGIPTAPAPDDPTPVVEIGEIFEQNGLTLIGTSLPRFLRMMTASRLAGESEMDAASILGMPDSLLAPCERLEPFVAWADPMLPFPEPDPYVQRLTNDDIARLIGSGTWARR